MLDAVKVFVIILLSLGPQLGWGFPQNVVIDTTANYFRTTPDLTERQAAITYRNFEIEIINTRQVKTGAYYYLLFRYRDGYFSRIFKPLYTQGNPLVKIWCLNALSQIQSGSDFGFIKNLTSVRNTIHREMVANAFSFFGRKDDLSYLRQWLGKENNPYVSETVKAAIKVIQEGGYPNLFPYLPVFYKSDIKKLKFFYNKSVESKKNYHKFYGADPKDETQVKVRKMVYPHQQYLHPLKNAPKKGSFGNKHGPIYHTGEDSGWFLEGLPIHSVAAGVVKTINHETSWGVFVSIESKLPNDSMVMVYYGHLSRNLNIMPGDTVYTGQKIGQIGNSVSYENGGYWPHLHLGMEKADYRHASFTGYDTSLTRWMDPVEVIECNHWGNVK